MGSWRGQEKEKREIPREKGRRARGRSSGSSEARGKRGRVAASNQGLLSEEHAVLSRLASRENGRETCVPARRKRAVFSHPRQTLALVVSPSLNPAKRETRGKIVTNVGCVNTFHFFLFPSVSRVPVKSGRDTRE